MIWGCKVVVSYRCSHVVHDASQRSVTECGFCEPCAVTKPLRIQILANNVNDKIGKPDMGATSAFHRRS